MEDILLNSISPVQPPVTPEYMKEASDSQQASYTREQAIEAGAKLSFMDGTMSSLWGEFKKKTEDPSPMLSVEELKKMYPHLSANFKQPMSANRAVREVEREEDRRRFENIMQQSPQDFLGKTGQLAGSLAGGIDPADIALASLLGFAEIPLLASGSKGMSFFKTNLAENILSEGIVRKNLASPTSLREYNLDDSVTNIGMGTGAGQLLYGVGRGLQWAANKRNSSNLKKIAIANEVGGKKPDTNIKASNLENTTLKDPGHVHRPLASHLNDRPFYNVSGSDETPFSSVFGKGGIVTVDNKSAANLLNSTGDSIDIETHQLNFKGDQPHTLLDGGKSIDATLVNSPDSVETDAMIILNKHLGDEYASTLHNEKNLHDIFERIDEDLREGKLDNETEFKQKLDSAIMEMKERGIDGIKLDYGDNADLNTNAVIFFDESRLKEFDSTKNLEPRAKASESDMKEQVAQAQDFKTNYGYDAEAHAKFKELPETYVAKISSDVKAEVDKGIEDAQLAHQSGAMTKEDLDGIISRRAELEDELTVLKMADACSFGGF